MVTFWHRIAPSADADRALREARFRVGNPALCQPAGSFGAREETWTRRGRKAWAVLVALWPTTPGGLPITAPAWLVESVAEGRPIIARPDFIPEAVWPQMKAVLTDPDLRRLVRWQHD